MKEALVPFLSSYRRLLEEVDAWFARCRKGAGERMACGSGCHGCCRGLFDITLLDAALLKSGFDSLEKPVREEVLDRAGEALERLQKRWPGFSSPYLLNHMPEEEWTDGVRDVEDSCLLLSREGLCLVYDHRPMTCRLHGLPHVDVGGEIFGEEGCTLNFPGEDPLALSELRWEFRRLFERELLLFRDFTRTIYGQPRNELDTFIPAALMIDFDALVREKTPEK